HHRDHDDDHGDDARPDPDRGRAALRARHRLVLGELAQGELRARKRARGRPKRSGASSGWRWTGTRPDAAVSTSARNSAAVWYRSSRFFVSACSTTASSAGETLGLMMLGLTGRSLTCWYATATGVSPRNGGRPVSISKSTTPVEYRSVRASTVSPLACSGEK